MSEKSRRMKEIQQEEESKKQLTQGFSSHCSGANAPLKTSSRIPNINGYQDVTQEIDPNEMRRYRNVPNQKMKYTESQEITPSLIAGKFSNNSQQRNQTISQPQYQNQIQYNKQYVDYGDDNYFSGYDEAHQSIALSSIRPGQFSVQQNNTEMQIQDEVYENDQCNQNNDIEIIDELITTAKDLSEIAGTNIIQQSNEQCLLQQSGTQGKTIQDVQSSQIPIDYSTCKEDGTFGLESLNDLVNENEEITRNIQMLKEKHSLDDENEMNMINIRESGVSQKLAPNFIPESLFRLIDEMDELRFENPSTSQTSENAPQQKKTEFIIQEEDELLEAQNSFKPKYSFKQNVQKRTEFIIEDEEMLEEKSFKPNKKTDFVINEEEEYIEVDTFKQPNKQQDFLETITHPALNDEINDNDVFTSSQKPKDTLRDKFIMTKEDFSKTINQELNVIPLDKQVLPKSNFLEGLQQCEAPPPKPTKRKIAKQQEPQEEDQLPVPASPAETDKKKTKRIKRKKVQADDRAENLMMSLKTNGSSIEQLITRIMKLNEEQRIQIMQVLNKVENGEVEAIQDMQMLTGAKNDDEFMESVRKVNKKVLKPGQSSAVVAKPVGLPRPGK
ncbi:Conserved_hypothetical protein [Hexamita inflata]|uniref:Uncharacterized protein n=1 Tax=Hexamita inflata TaxID=28002 RepID=A0ABP1HZA7_9EUKA